ncbi:hypothetical protein OBV_27100 [Oscillibacter valericigenes Sjm18-20]|nr:hypothetical protein OBV_27100 [Oscillibacter valericigenes Sjm18-20]
MDESIPGDVWIGLWVSARGNHKNAVEEFAGMLVRTRMKARGDALYESYALRKP